MYKTILSAVVALGIAASPLIKPSDVAFAQAKSAITLQPKLSYDPNLEHENFTVSNNENGKKLLHLYYSRKNSLFLLRECNGCEEHKDLIKKAIDLSVESLTNGTAPEFYSLRKCLRRVSREIEKGGTIESGVKKANDNQEELDTKGTVIGYAQETHNTPDFIIPADKDIQDIKVNTKTYGIDSLLRSEYGGMVNGRRTDKSTSSAASATYEKGSMLQQFLSGIKKDTASAGTKEGTPDTYEKGSMLEKFLSDVKKDRE